MAHPADNLSLDMSDLLKPHTHTKTLVRLTLTFMLPYSLTHSLPHSHSSTHTITLSSDLIFFCSVRSPSLTSIAESSLSVELADLDWLFFMPSNQRTRSLMACTYNDAHIHTGSLKLAILREQHVVSHTSFLLPQLLTLASTSGDTSSSVVHSLPFLFPDD